jgi:hypothetical protein
MILSLLFFLNIFNHAHAGTISLVGEHHLQVHYDTTNLALLGNIKVTNSGDSQAIDVAPNFQFKDWSWQGSPEPLAAGENHTWQIDQHFSFSGAKGIYPILELINYKDTNGYVFSSPGIISAEIGSFDSSQRELINTPALTLNLSFTKDGEAYLGKLTITNNAKYDRFLNIGFFTSRELSVEQHEIQELVKNGEPKKITIKVKNISSTIDSSYPVFAIAQWQDHDVHLFSQNTGILKITNDTNFSHYLIWAPLGFIFALLTIAFFIWRILKHDVK